MKLLDKKLKYDGDIFRIVGVGASDDNQIYLHLASTTRFRKQRNGKSPVQLGLYLDQDFVANNLVEGGA